MLLVDKLNKGRLPEKPDNGGDVTSPPPPPPLGVKPQSIASRIPNVERIKKTIHEQLIASLGFNSDNHKREDVLKRIGELVDQYCDDTKLKLTKFDRDELCELIIDDVLGLGLLEGLLADPEVSEIMVNGPKTIFIERRGRITQSQLAFDNETQLRQVTDRIVARLGCRVAESCPIVDARLQDGSRVNVVTPPVAGQ